MVWNDVLGRFKDARTWAMITSLGNAAMVYLKVEQQVMLIVDGSIALVAFLLFGVESVAAFIRSRQK